MIHIDIINIIFKGLQLPIYKIRIILVLALMALLEAVDHSVAFQSIIDLPTAQLPSAI
jgi:hypothetical protein